MACTNRRVPVAQLDLGSSHPPLQLPKERALGISSCCLVSTARENMCAGSGSDPFGGLEMRIEARELGGNGLLERRHRRIGTRCVLTLGRRLPREVDGTIVAINRGGGDVFVLESPRAHLDG